MPVDVAIKELIGEELVNLLELQGKAEERFSTLEKNLEELSGVVDGKGREADTLREDLEKLRSDSEAIDVRAKTLEDLDVSSLAKRVELLESDEEGGLGGLKQVREKLEAIEKSLGELQPRQDETSRIAAAAKSRTDEFELLLNKYGKQLEDFHSVLDSSKEKLENLEGVCSDVTADQKALKESVARKYDSLWQDVLNALEEFKANQMEEMKLFHERQSSRKADGKNLATYALNVLGSAHEERKKMAAGKDLLVAWREQTWASARRRHGIWRLHCMAQRRQREAWTKWARRIEVQQLAKSFRETYPPDELNVLRERLSDLESQGDGLRDQCNSLDRKCASMDTSIQEKCPVNLLDTRLGEQEIKVKNLIGESIERVNEKQESTFNEMSNQQQAASERVQGLDDRLTDNETQVTSLGEIVSECAKAREVQTMMRDTLLMWNSIKQLDAAKADKKELHALGLESSSRCQHIESALKTSEIDVASRVREEVHRTQERWNDLDTRVEESAKQFRHWEQMWERLAGYVEDLVAKIADLQASTATRPPGSRTSSRDPTERGNRGSVTVRLDMPRLGHGAAADHDANASASTVAATGAHAGLLRADSANSVESHRTLWDGSAKGIVDATLDQAYGQPPRPRARPKSASVPSVRRGHDRP